jgi:hypothetical protein
MALNCPKCGSPLASGDDQLDCPRCSTAVMLPALRTAPASAARPVAAVFDPRSFLAPREPRLQAAGAAGFGGFGARQATALAPRALSPALFILIAAGTAILFLGSALLFRAPFVEARPGPVNLLGVPAPEFDHRDLAIRNVDASRIVVGEQPIFMLEGEIANTGSRELSVPAIRVSLKDGSEEIFAWTVEPAESTLAAGAALSFKSRVAAPAGAGNLELSFVAPD